MKKPATAELFGTILTLLIIYSAATEACDPRKIATMDKRAFRYEWGEVSWQKSSSSQPTFDITKYICPPPPCLPAPYAECNTWEPSTVFIRPNALASNPIYQPPVRGSYCFSIDKLDDSHYYHLHFVVEDTITGTPAGFWSSISSDGISWTLGDLAFSGEETAWCTSVICPDVHYRDGMGSMYLYFQGGAEGIGYATSNNYGRTFVDSGSPVLVSETPHYMVRTPSVVEYRNMYYMVYNLVCMGETSPFQLATLNLAVSNDGINWQKSANNPIVVAGECNQFDRGAVALGQLVVDRDGETLHLFYAGADWKVKVNNNVVPPDSFFTTRGCTKIGHAVSTDYGRNWCKTGSPVLDHPAPGSQAWDTGSYYVSSYAWETNQYDQDVLRMYYWANYPDSPDSNNYGLGIAEAAELPACPLVDVPDTTRSGRHGASFQKRVLLESYPNPTIGSTTISHDLPLSSWRGAATLVIYNLRGEIVRKVWAGNLETVPEQFTWDGRSDAGTQVASGRYLLRLDSGGATAGAHWITVLR